MSTYRNLYRGGTDKAWDILRDMTEEEQREWRSKSNRGGGNAVAGMASEYYWKPKGGSFPDATERYAWRNAVGKHNVPNV